VNVNDFLKPAEGESPRDYYGGQAGRGGRGRGFRGGEGGRGRGGEARGNFGGARGAGFGGRGDARGFQGGRTAAAPKIGDDAQFPTLGGK
jgi:plasminogen activator inhibitor 1 RNA-binding protein